MESYLWGMHVVASVAHLHMLNDSSAQGCSRRLFYVLDASAERLALPRLQDASVAQAVSGWAQSVSMVLGPTPEYMIA